MRLLLVHQGFTSPQNAGGTRHYELAKRIVDRGHDVTIVASDLAYLTGERAEGCRGLMTEQDLDGVRILRAYTYPSLHSSYMGRVWSFLSFMITSFWASMKSGPVDLVVATTPPIFQAFSTWLVAAIRRKPFLLEVRDLWPEFAIDIGLLKNPILIFVARRLETFLYGRATHIVVNSPAYRDYLLERGIRSEKVSFIPNGVDPKMFESISAGDFRQEFGLEEKYLVVYAGALGMANDIDTILNAADILKNDPEIHIAIAGDGKERQRLIDRANQMELSNVTFAGPRAKTEMPSVLATTDVCVATLKNIPMFRTTYPNKIFDYMAAAKPTVLAIDGVIREVVEAAQGGIFAQPGDPQAIADAISRLKNHPDEAQQMGRAARDYVGRHFNRDEHAEALLALINRMVSDESRQPATRTKDSKQAGFYSSYGKRILDVSLCLPACLLLLPLYISIAIAVRLLLGRPVLFRQERPGLYGRPFELLKFRTMSDQTDEQGELLPDAMRLGRFGRFLRSTSLDELPELWNILKGDMSLVGPRPLLMRYLTRYNATQFRRHEVKPGLTGWAQVNGRNAIDWETKLALDVEYVDRFSLAGDLWILLLTIAKVLTRNDISTQGHATAPEFRGAETTTEHSDAPTPEEESEKGFAKAL